MPAVTRQGIDKSAGHCYPPTVPTAGSANVITNAHPTVRVDDMYEDHTCGTSTHSGRKASAGSATVIVNGKPVHRIGDAIDCGDVSASGSDNVFAGDGSFPVLAVAVVVEPGVTSVGGVHVYDNSAPGQAAARRDENAFDPLLGASEKTGIAPPPAPTESPSIPVSCDKFPAVITMSDMSLQASKYFKLSHSAKSGMITAQRGLTASQIACNWAALCTNILDPVYENFKFKFNSGFRTVASGMGNTDHGIGCAADISMSTTEDTIAMFKWMVHANLPFSQIIYEKHNSAWVHVAFNGAGPKGDARTMWTFTGSAPYGHGGSTGGSLPSILLA